MLSLFKWKLLLIKISFIEFPNQHTLLAVYLSLLILLLLLVYQFVSSVFSFVYKSVCIPLAIFWVRRKGKASFE